MLSLRHREIPYFHWKSYCLACITICVMTLFESMFIHPPGKSKQPPTSLLVCLLISLTTFCVENGVLDLFDLNTGQEFEIDGKTDSSSSSSFQDSATTTSRKRRNRKDRYPNMPAWQITDYKHGSTFLINQGGGRFIIHISNYDMSLTDGFPYSSNGKEGKNGMVIFESLKERMEPAEVDAVKVRVMRERA